MAMSGEHEGRVLASLATEHLRQIGVELQGGDVQGVLAQIIETLEWLESSLLALEEQVECATIDAASVRHQLKRMPAQIRQEVSAAVRSARSSNANQLNWLRGQLDTLCERVSVCTAETARLSTANEALQQHKASQRQRHELAVRRLNLRLEEKARAQILLNETRDALQLSHQITDRLKNEMVSLRAAMIEERATARARRDALNAELSQAERTLQLSRQQEKSVSEEKQQALKMASNAAGRLQEARSVAETSEARVAQLDGQRAQLEEAIQHAREERARLNGALLAIELEDGHARTQADDTLKELHQHKAQREAEEHRNTVRLQQLEADRRAAEKRLQEAREDRQKQADKLNNAVKRADMLRQSSVQLSSDVVRLKDEADTMERERMEMQDAHRATMDGLQSELAFAKEQLTELRTELEALKHRRDEDTVRMGRERDHAEAELRQTNGAVRENMRLTEELQSQASKTKMRTESEQRQLRQEEASKAELSRQLAHVQAQRAAQMADARSQVEHLREQLQVAKQQLQEQTVPFEQLVARHQSASSQHEAKKRDVAGRRTQEGGLKQALEAAIARKPQMDEELRKLQHRLAEESQLQARAIGDKRQALLDLETALAEAEVTLERGDEENCRMRGATDALSERVGNIERRRREVALLVRASKMECEAKRSRLSEGWHVQEERERARVQGDEKHVQSLSALASDSERREQQVSSMAERVRQELELLQRALD